jgi:Amt family ammonium transporter
MRFGKPSLIGVVTGMVAGLATITPASGFVGPAGGVALGLVGGIACYRAVDLIKRRIRIDDSLDVFAVHGVGGILGTLLCAVFAASPFGGAGLADGVGIADQLGRQALGCAAVIAWSAIATVVIVKLTAALVGLRAAEPAVSQGLDLAVHGESGYTL